MTHASAPPGAKTYKNLSSSRFLCSYYLETDCPGVGDNRISIMSYIRACFVNLKM